MANEIKLRIKVEDDGGLSIVGKKAKETSKDIDKLGKSTDKATKSQNNFDRGLKGVGQGGLSAAKGFSKMRDEMGGSSGLVAAYATLAANVFAATAAFNALKRAAEVQTMISALEEIGQASGRSLKVLASNIREITNGAISMEQALKTASIGTSAGFDSSTLQDLAKVARLAATALGRDVGDATDRLTRGVAKLEPEILDELGIMVRLDDATRKYAAALGVSASSLSTFEKSQAFANATIEQGLTKFRDVEDVELSGFTKLAATFSDLGQTILGFVATALEPLADFLANSKVALAGLIAVLSQGIVNQALPFIQQFTQKAREAAAAALQAAGAAKTLSFTQQMGAAGGGGVGRVGGKAKELVAALERGENVRENSLKLEQSLNLSLGKRVANIKKLAANAKTAQEKEAVRVKRREAAEIRLDRILLKRAQRSMDSPDFKSMEQRTAFADAETSILGSLDEDMSFSNLKKQFGEARKAGARYRKETVLGGNALSNFMLKIPLLGKGLLIGGRAFTSFGIAGKVALKGITYAIPFFGQFVLVLELVKGAFSKLIDLFTQYGPAQSEASKAQEAAAGTLDTYSKVLKSVADEGGFANDVLIKVGNATKETTKAISKSTEETLKARENMGLFARIIDKIVSAVRALGKNFAIEFKQLGLDLDILILKFKMGFFKMIEENESLFQRLSDAVARVTGVEPTDVFSEKDELFLRNAPRQLEELQRRRAALQTGGNLSNELFISDAFEGFTQAIIGGGAQAKELEKIIGQTDIKSVDFAKNIMQGGEALSGYSNELIALRNGYEQNADGTLKASGGIQFFNDLLEQSSKRIIQQGDALQSLRGTIKESAEEFGKFFTSLRGSDTPFTKIGQRLETIVRSIDTFNGGLEQSDDNSEALFQEIDKLTDQQKEFLGITNLYGQALTDQLKTMRDLVREADERIRSEKRLLSVQKRYSSAAKLASKENTVAAEFGLQAADETAQITQRKLQSQIKLERESATIQGKALGDRVITQELLNQADMAEMAVLQQIAAKEEEINALGGKILGTKGIQLNTEKLINQQKQNSLKVDQQIAAANEKIIKAQQVIANIAGGRAGAQTEVQKFEAQVRAAEVGVKVAKAEVGFTQERLRLETEIMGIKLLALGVEGTKVDEILEKQRELNRETIRAAEAKADAAEAELTSLKLSRHVAGQVALGMEASANNIIKIMDGINLAGSRYNTELGSSGALTTRLSNLTTGKTKDKLEEDRLVASADREAAKLSGNTEDEQAAMDKIAAIDAQIRNIPTAIIQTEGAVAQSFLSMIAQGVQPFQEELKKLGPAGEYAASLNEGALLMASSWIAAITEIRVAMKDLEGVSIKSFKDIGELSGKQFRAMATIAAAGLSAISSSMSALQNVMNAASKNRIAGIDAQIAAEKKQGAGSAKSLEKIKALEAKKLALKKKEFEMNKKMNIANAIISTAAGVAAALSIPVVGMFIAPLIAAMGMKQVQLIRGMTFQGGAAEVNAPTSSVSMGKRNNTVDVAQRASGGELAYLRGQRGVGTNANDFTPAFYGSKKMRAMGGAVAGYTVGEQGPELFVPSVPGQIVPNDEVAGAQPINVSFNVQAIDSSSFNDALTLQRGNIISIIREAANGSGEGFLETVDVESLKMER